MRSGSGRRSAIRDSCLACSFEEVGIAGTIQAQIERALSFSSEPFEPKVGSTDPTEIFHHRYAALYGKGGDIDALALQYAACDLSGLGVYAFDGLFLFLVDRRDGQLLVWSDANLKNIRHTDLPVLAFDRLASEYLHQLEDEIASI